jgi:hypothetical protein
VSAACAALAWAGSANAATRILAMGDFGVGAPYETQLGEAMRRFEAHRQT